MEKLIQYCTRASLYDGAFGGAAGWPAAGMGYVFVTKHGHLIAVDGGHGEDAEPFLSLLTTLSGDSRLAVDLWMITHPHRDHYGILQKLAARDDLRGQVEVRELLWCFPADFRDKGGNAPCDKANHHLREVCKALGAAERTPQTGEAITVDGLALRFWFVPTDCRTLTNPNSLSLIFSVKSDRKAVMMTGDACPVTMQYCADAYGDALRSDILQLPHHGLCDTGNPDFYGLVGADTLLIPISKAGDAAMKSGVYGEATAANRLAESLSKAVYHAFEGTASLEL